MSVPFTDEEIAKLKSGAVAHCMKNEIGDWVTLVSRLLATIDEKNNEIVAMKAATNEINREGFSF